MKPEDVFLILLWLAEAGVGAYIGHRKGRPWLGFVLGLITGVLGWIVMAFVRPTHDELVRREKERQSIVREAQGSEQVKYRD